MGLCSSGFQARFDQASYPLEKFAAKLKISKGELMKSYKIFEKIDMDKSGQINLDEFFDFFDLEFSSFGQRCFAVMDVDQSRDYCTMKHSTLVKFAFDMFDTDGSGQIGKAEMATLMKMIHGKQSAKSEKVITKLLKECDDDKNGEISLREWREMEKNARSLLFPAFMLQRKLCEKYLGNNYWKKATTRRYANTRDEMDLIEMNHLLNEGKKLDRKKIAEEANKSKEGRVRSELKTIDVLDAPSNDANKIDTLKSNALVQIAEERVDNDDPNLVWYLIDRTQQRWVKGTFIKIDATWLKAEAEKERQAQAEIDRTEGSEKKKREREEKIRELKAIWVEATDPKSGRKYWYNKNTQATTWDNPFKF
jgi:Ca2+-binding EF-hand superfamily protein